MKLRAYSALLMSFIMIISSASYAQWGVGLYGGMQMCPGLGPASGASSDDDEVDELNQERRELRKEKRDLERSYRQMERDLDSIRESITGVVKSNWANVITQHMDQNMNCGVCGTQTRHSHSHQESSGTGLSIPPTTKPPVSRTTVIEEVVEPAPVPAPAPAPAPRPPQPAIPHPVREPAPIEIVPLPPLEPAHEGETPAAPVRPRPKPPKKPDSDSGVTKTTSIDSGAATRGIASVTDGDSQNMAQMSKAPQRAPAQEVSAQAAFGTIGDDAVHGAPDYGDFGLDLGEQNYGYQGGSTLCNPAVQPYTMNAWRAICRGQGRIDQRVCRDRYYQNGEVRPAAVNACARGLDRYRRISQEMTKAQTRLATIEDEIAEIGYRISDVKRERRLDRDDGLEAGCPDGNCYKTSSRRKAKDSGPSLGQTLLAVGLDALSIGGSIYLGKQANEWNARTGHQAVPYVATGLMGGAFYPYRTAGLYGGIYGGMNGAYGCSPGMGNPMMGGAFGYPGMMGMNPYAMMGGGMYNPGMMNPMAMMGMNPMAMIGMNPMMSGMMNPYGMMGGIGGGLMGGMGMMNPYGMMGGIGGGLMGGMGGMMNPYGMMGGLGGMGGLMGGGMGMMNPYGMMGGMGMMNPYGMMGGMGMMNPYGMMGGMGMMNPYGMMGGMGMMDPQMLQLQSQMMQQYQEQASYRMRLYSSFMSEYMQFQMKWNMYFGSGSLGGGIGGGIGTGTPGYVPMIPPIGGNITPTPVGAPGGTGPVPGGTTPVRTR